jgi:hypothetical protein
MTNKQAALGETDTKPWYEWEWSEIVEESNFITFPYEDYWVCRYKYEHDAVAVGATRQGALDNCILVLCLYSGVERADNQGERTAKVIVEEDEDWIYMTCSHCERLLMDGDTDGYEWSGCVENYCQFCGAKFEDEQEDTI